MMPGRGQGEWWFTKALKIPMRSWKLSDNRPEEGILEYRLINALEMNMTIVMISLV